MNILSKVHLPYGLGSIQCLEVSELNDEQINQIITYKVVCRTALATPGLLNTSCHVISTKNTTSYDVTNENINFPGAS